MKLRCIIIEDEPLAREIIEKYLVRHGQFELQGSYENVGQALKMIQSNPPEILFLDIKMPGITGLELLTQMPERPLTILTTAFREYALEAYDLGVIDYLVKPIRYERFKKAADRAAEFLLSSKMDVEFLQNEKETTIAIKSGTKSIIVSLESISHVQGLKDYTILFADDKKYVVNGSIKTILQYLPGDQFIRVHKSFIVAKRKIVVMQRNKIEFGDYQIPIGRVYKSNLDEIFKNRS